MTKIIINDMTKVIISFRCERDAREYFTKNIFPDKAIEIKHGLPLEDAPIEKGCGTCAHKGVFEYTGCEYECSVTYKNLWQPRTEG